MHVKCCFRGQKSKKKGPLILVNIPTVRKISEQLVNKCQVHNNDILASSKIAKC